MPARAGAEFLGLTTLLVESIGTASAYVASYDKSPYVDRVRAFLGSPADG
jgi:hypothetical protein